MYIWPFVMANQEISLKWNGYQNNLLCNVKELYKDECLSDVTIVSEGHSFKAHKVILSANSSVFRSIFQVILKIPCERAIFCCWRVLTPTRIFAAKPPQGSNNSATWHQHVVFADSADVYVQWGSECDRGVPSSVAENRWGSEGLWSIYRERGPTWYWGTNWLHFLRHCALADD